MAFGGGNQVTLVFAGDASKLDRTFKQVGTGATAMGNQVGSTSGRFRAVGVAAAAAGVVLGRVLFQLGRDSIKEFAEAEQAQLRLQDAFKRFPALADSNIDRLRKLNTELAQKTRFDDDAFASGQAVLAQFKLTGQQLDDLTPTLADFAAKTGRDLPTAATVLGKAFLGNTRALKELGINYKSTGDHAKDVANITALLQGKVGGFAEKEGKTAAGQAAIMSNRFGELKETLGEKLLPVMLKVTEIGIKVVDWVSKNAEILGPLAAVLATVVAVQWAWNIALTANPIGVIVMAIALLIAAIVYVATKTDWFQRLWRAAWGGIKSIVSGVIDWFGKLPERMGRLFIRVAKAITSPFHGAFNFIADLWNNTIGRLRWTVPGWVPFIGGNTIAAPQLPRFHRGGVVPGAPGTEMLAMVQAGETITPAGATTRVVIEVRSGGTRFDDALTEIIRKVVGEHGGNVQTAFGKGQRR